MSGRERGENSACTHVPWSEELGSRLDDRFGEGAGEIVKRLMESTAFTSEGQLYRVFGMFNTPAAEWPDIVDAVMAAHAVLGDMFFCVDIPGEPRSAMRRHPRASSACLFRYVELPLCMEIEAQA